MSPEDVLYEIEKGYGVRVSRKTLQRYTNDGLIPPPIRGSYGRGVGAFAEYNDDTPALFIVAYLNKRGGNKSLSVTLEKRIEQLETELRTLRFLCKGVGMS